MRKHHCANFQITSPAAPTRLLPKHFSCVFVIAIQLCAFSSFAATMDFLNTKESTWLDEHRHNLKILIVDNSAPDTFIDDSGQRVGLLVDFYREIEQELGVNFEVVPFDNWGDLMSHSEHTENYIIVGAARTSKREKFLLFTDPFTKAPYVLVAKSKSTNLEMADLSGKVICTVKTFSVNDYLRQYYPNIVTKPVQNTISGLRDVLTGDCEIMTANQMYVSYLVDDQQMHNLRIVGDTGYIVRLSLATSIRDPFFHDILEKTIEHISSERKLEITRRWINPHEPSTTHIWRLFLPILLIFLSTLGIMWLWSTSLKRQVSRHLKDLRANEMEFQQYIENASTGMFVIDFRGRFIRANSAFARLAQKDKTALLKMRALELIGQEQAEGIGAKYQKAALGDVLEFETVIKDKTNGTKYVSVNTVVIENKKILGFTTDITEQKILQAENERLVWAIEQADDAVLISNTNGKIEYVNRAFEEISGYSADELLGESTLRFSSSIAIEIESSNSRSTLKDGGVWHCAVIHSRKDRSTYMCESTITPIVGLTGEIEFYVSTMRDISQQLEMEAEKKALEVQYHQAQKVDSIGRLAGGVAHDLNNLLIPILCYGELLKEGLSSESETQEYADDILKAGNRARDLVAQLLAYSRSQTLNFSTVDLNEVMIGLRSMINTLFTESIDVNITQSKDPCFITADVPRLEQVIMNFAMNSAGAMTAGGTITFSLEIKALSKFEPSDHEKFPSGNYVCLNVIDEGCGMDEETQSRMFEPFFTTKGDQGNGLGLATAYGIVKQHKGYIDVDSRLGEGTRITIMLPEEETPNQPSTSPRSLSAASKAGTKEGNELILLAEDDYDIRQISRRVLEKNGYEVIIAKNGAEALAFYKQSEQKIDLLITDVIMPIMSGKELYSTIREANKDIKVIYVSGYTADVVKNEDLQASQVNFLQKPFSIDGLANKVREVLDGR